VNGANVKHAKKTTRPFLHIQSDQEFVNFLDRSELHDKTRILAFRHLMTDGKFQHTEELKQLVREEGIPPRYRWPAWKALSGWSETYQPGLWEQVTQKNPDRSALESISKDLHRTFPGRDDFDEVKQKQLGQVCQAYAYIHPQISYVQGMNFIAGLLLLISDSPEDVFFMFVQVMIKYSASLLFHPGLPLLKLYTFQFRRLLEIMLPEVHSHFYTQCITPELYITKWFLTLFANMVMASDGDPRMPISPISRVSCIWDIVLCDDLQVIVMVAVACVQILQSRLLMEETEGILELLSLRGPQELMPPGRCMVKTAVGLKLPDGTSVREKLSLLRGVWAQEHPEDAAELDQATENLCSVCALPLDALPLEAHAAFTTSASEDPVSPHAEQPKVDS